MKNYNSIYRIAINCKNVNTSLNISDISKFTIMVLASMDKKGFHTYYIYHYKCIINNKIHLFMNKQELRTKMAAIKYSQ